MGDFLSPSSTSVSNVSGSQQKVQTSLGTLLSGLLEGSGIEEAITSLLAGTPQDITDIEDAAFRNFNTRAVPSINAQAAGLSATQNSRRVGEIARAAGDVTAQLAGIKAQTIESARNRQLGAFSAIVNPSAGFSTAGTVDNITEGSLFGQLAGLGGTLGGAAILGSKLGPAGAVAGSVGGLSI